MKDVFSLVREKGFYKRIAALSLPIAAQSIITYSVSLLDNIMVGKLGETAVSGVYIANQITSFLQMFVTGISAALLVLAAQYWGKNDKGSVKSVISIAFKLCFAAASLLFFAMFFFTDDILSLFTDEADVISAGAEYVKIISFTYLPFCIANVLVASMRCVETVGIGTKTALAALIVNLFLNWVLIFGKLGMPVLGIRGAAIATLISRLTELSIMLVYVLKIDKKLKIRLRELCRFGSPHMRNFFKYGAPVIAGDMVWGLNLMTQGAIVGHLGTPAIAAVSIANTMFALISVGSYGIRDGAAIIIGKTVGTGDFDRVRQYAKTLQLLFLCVGAVTGLIVLLSSRVVPFFYNNMDTETLHITRQMLYVLSVTVVGTSYQMATLTGIVRAGGATHFVLINDMIFVWLVAVPSALVAAFVLGAPAWAVFACLKCDQILKCPVAFIKCNRFRWIKNLTK